MPRTSFAALTATLLAALALPVAAAAEETIPPGNSAVNQYTESLPTPGGDRDTESGGHKSRPSPNKALGSQNARKLEAQGSDGRAAAAAAAATAPSTAPAPAPAEEEEKEKEATAPAGGGNANPNGGGQAADRGDGGSGAKGEARGASLASVEVDEPGGSSGVGEVIGEATGGSSGEMGWLLPLLIVAVAIWAFAYAMRQRRRVS